MSKKKKGTPDVEAEIEKEELEEIEKRFKEEVEKYREVKEAIEQISKNIPEEMRHLLELLQKWIWFTVIPSKQEGE